jgi:hypothetical protein
MISYTLRCSEGHEFEAWFRSSADYDKAVGKTVCPACNSKKVEKALMAPAVARTDKGSKMPVAAADPRQAAMREALRELRRKVTENADYVGDKFAEEARKIHYNETEPRGIYGEANMEDAKALLEEGIEFHPLPMLPEDGN